MPNEAWLFRLAVRITGLVLTVAWIPTFFSAAFAWFGASRGWHAEPSGFRPETSNWDWLVFVAKDGLGLAVGLYLLMDGRMVIEGLYPSLRPRGIDAPGQPDAHAGETP